MLSVPQPLSHANSFQVVPDLRDHGIYAGAGRDHDDVAVGRRWCELSDQERALQLNRRVVGVLFAPRLHDA